MLTVIILAIATGVFLALGIALALEKAPDRLLSIFIILMACWLFGSTLAAYLVQ
jgi:hypothetical protein